MVDGLDGFVRRRQGREIARCLRRKRLCIEDVLEAGESVRRCVDREGVTEKRVAEPCDVLG